MSVGNLPYFKFVTHIIRSHVWARLSPGARTLYPVLLSFSDGNFKPVYPGTKTLLELTGFKHKASLRKARNELEQKGLVTLCRGTGRANTYYQFRADFTAHPQGDSSHTLRGIGSAPPEGGRNAPSGGAENTSQYNQIHISIKNQPNTEIKNPPETGERGDKDNEEKAKWDSLKHRFGAEAVRLACSECRLGSLYPSLHNVEQILNRSSSGQEKRKRTWSEIKRALAREISPMSLDMVCHAFQKETGDLLIFEDSLTEHLKMLLQQVCPRVSFKPPEHIVRSSEDFEKNIFMRSIDSRSDDKKF